MLDKISLLSSATGAGKINPVTLITGIKYATSLVKVFNNMTFMYDPNWEYDAENPSYPISFFFVRSMTEQMSSDISQRPMLFYNTASDTDDSTKGGLMNIVADNIIIKPKTYKLDVVIPANGTTLSNTIFNFDNMSAVYNFLAEKSTVVKAVDNAVSLNGSLSSINEAVYTGVSSCIDILTVLFKSLYGTEISVSSLCNALLQQQDYNKYSIEDMWRNRRIVKLKLWNGWKFKYLAIKDCDITKVGEDGDFYTGTITCQEMPIITFREQSSSSVSTLSQISAKLGELQKTAVDTFVSAMEATLGD